MTIGMLINPFLESEPHLHPVYIVQFSREKLKLFKFLLVYIVGKNFELKCFPLRKALGSVLSFRRKKNASHCPVG